MTFSIADYVEIQHALVESSRQERAIDDKRLGRIAVQGEVLVTIVRPGGELGLSFSAIARDISINGIGLVQHRPPQRASRLIVQLPRTRSNPLRLLCNIAYARELAEGVYAVGAIFLGEATPAMEPSDEAAAEVARLRRAVID